MTRVELTALYPQLPGEDADKWTDRVLSHAGEHGTNRQCSIGWHGECSDRSGESCQCLCHDDATRWFTVEGYPHGGGHLISRAEQGKQSWPAQPGEQAGTWAHWIMAASVEQAETRAIGKQQRIDGVEPESITNPDPEQEPDLYWDDDPQDTENQPFGVDTARIVDLRVGGVIAYVHRENADRLVMALRGAGYQPR